jgi:hypothetical protein
MVVRGEEDHEHKEKRYYCAKLREEHGEAIAGG